MIAIYCTDELGADLALYDSDEHVEAGAADDSWRSTSSELPVTADLNQITAFLLGHYWRVQGGTWAYDQGSDQFIATAYREC